MVTPEELAAWLHHPVTQAFRERTQRARADLMELWASGGTIEDDAFKTAVNNAVLSRQCQLLASRFDVTPEDLNNE